MDNIVPLTMEARRSDIDARHLFFGYLTPWLITTAIQTAGNRQSLSSGGGGNQPDYSLVVSQRFAAPVGANEREQPMLHFVPLAGSRWEMAHRYRQPGLVGQALQLQLPKPQPIPVAAAAIGGDQQAVGLPR